MTNPFQPHPNDSDTRAQLHSLLSQAKTQFQQRNPKAAAQTLHTAQSTASRSGLHREAAILGRALAILATGSKPKLLTNPHATLNDD